MTKIKGWLADMASVQGIKAQDCTPVALPDSAMLEWLTQFYRTTCPLPKSFMATRNDGPPQMRENMSA